LSGLDDAHCSGTVSALRRNAGWTAMVAAAWDGEPGEADYVLLLVDAKSGLTEAVRGIIKKPALSQ
jgi:hypothetical protein